MYDAIRNYGTIRLNFEKYGTKLRSACYEIERYHTEVRYYFFHTVFFQTPNLTSPKDFFVEIKSLTKNLIFHR